METSFISESLVDVSDVEETVTQVLTQLGDPARVYTVICVEINRTPKQSRFVCSKRCRRRWCHRPNFFNFVVEEE
jgi:hypothetical protein